MRQVEFEHVRAEWVGYGLGKGMENQFTGAEECIQARIQEGWDYQGYLPLTTRGTGEIEEISLVFVREE